MRFKLDENLDPRLATLLEEEGHDVATVRDQGLGGADDDALFAVVTTEARTLVTLDLDFANPLRFPTVGTAGIVVLRLGRPILSAIEAALRSSLPHLRTGAVHGKLWIVEADRIREHRPWEEGADPSDPA